MPRETPSDPPHRSGMSHVQFSVELAVGPHQTALAQHRQLEHTAARLIRQFNEAGVRATWATAAFDGAPAQAVIAAASGGHELALLANGWAGQEVSRQEFQNELAARKGHATELGVNVTSLVWSKTERAAELDLVAKQGIRVVRAPYQRRTSRQAPATKKRYGIARVPATAAFPARRHWLDLVAARSRARQAVRRLSATGAHQHIVIQAADFLDASHLRGTLDAFLLAVVAATERNELTIETLEQAGQRLLPTTRRRATRSILRPAA